MSFFEKNIGNALLVKKYILPLHSQMRNKLTHEQNNKTLAL